MWLVLTLHYAVVPRTKKLVTIDVHCTDSNYGRVINHTLNIYRVGPGACLRDARKRNISTPVWNPKRFPCSPAASLPTTVAVLIGNTIK